MGITKKRATNRFILSQIYKNEKVDVSHYNIPSNLLNINVNFSDNYYKFQIFPKVKTNGYIRPIFIKQRYLAKIYSQITI